jgi:regulatory protein
VTEPERRITAIERQKRNPGRVNVFLDGEFAFGVPVNAVLDFGLKRGKVLTSVQIAELKELDEAAKATDAAIRLLTVRPRSTREIQLRLRQKQYDDATIEQVIERLREWKYIDDEAFARFWVENRESNRPRGRRLLEQELRFKGVDRGAVTQAIEDAGIDELAGALEIAREKLRSYEGLEPAVRDRRLGAFLARRGYGYDIVKRVLKELTGEEPAEE